MKPRRNKFRSACVFTSASNVVLIIALTCIQSSVNHNVSQGMTTRVLASSEPWIELKQHCAPRGPSSISLAFLFLHPSPTRSPLSSCLRSRFCWRRVDFSYVSNITMDHKVSDVQQAPRVFHQNSSNLADFRAPAADGVPIFGQQQQGQAHITNGPPGLNGGHGGMHRRNGTAHTSNGTGLVRDSVLGTKSRHIRGFMTSSIMLISAWQIPLMCPASSSRKASARLAEVVSSLTQSSPFTALFLANTSPRCVPPFHHWRSRRLI